MLMNGQWVPQWGSLYTAHADFINAWKTDSLQYAIDNCSNNGKAACSNAIPTYYSKAIADVWTNAVGVPTTTGSTLQVGPGDTIFLKFPTPANTTDYPWNRASLQTLGQNVTDTTAFMVNIYAAQTGWNENSPLPQSSDCSAQGVGAIYLDNVNTTRLNDITNYVKSSIAAGATQIGVCLRNTSGRTVIFSSKDGAVSPALYLN